MRGIGLVLLTFAVGCATVPEKMQKLQIGMSKPEVIGVLGDPNSVAARGKEEALYYTHSGFAADYWKTYFVNLVDGKVESFGQLGGSPAATVIYQMPAPAVQTNPVQFHPIQQNPAVNCTTTKSGDTAFTNCR